VTLTIGVDPGLTGAIAAVDGEQLCWVEDMPVAGGQVACALLDRLYDPKEYGPWQLNWPTEGAQPIAIEFVHSMPSQGVASTFKFGKAYGTVLGYFTANGHRITHVAPTEWKTTFRLTGKDKDAARLLAIELWPAQAQLFARKKDCGRADAALIALHHARTNYHTRVQTLRAERDQLDGCTGDAA
jgi:crossover junction endodeoxyribonuclease RuvC